MRPRLLAFLAVAIGSIAGQASAVFAQAPGAAPAPGEPSEAVPAEPEEESPSVRVELPAEPALEGAPQSPSPPPPPVPLPPPAPVRRWYGSQTLLVDGAVLATFIVAGSLNNDYVGEAAGFAYLLAPPIVHALHGNVGRAFADVGLRLITPVALGIAGAFIGVLVDRDSGGDTLPVGFTIGLVGGFLAGYVVVVATDAGILAYETVQPEPPRAQLHRRGPALELAPAFAIGSHGATLSARGRF